jgi:hypothetical protein
MLGSFSKRRAAAPAWAVLSLALLGLLPPAPARADNTETWDVQGTMTEYNGDGVATGDLAGTYEVKFITIVDNADGTITVHARRTITTGEGKLVLDEVGTVYPSGAISGVSSVSGGNGLFKKATGVLYASGEINADGTVTFTYAGTIELVD